MTKRRERGLCELYQNDPEQADWLVFGRRADAGRRGFLQGAGLASMAALVGAAIPLHRNLPAGLIPSALADDLKDFMIDGKDGLSVLNDRPLNAETPAHLLDDAVTPTARHFIRNNGVPPEDVDPSTWTLTVDGEVETPLELSIADLKEKFDVVTLQLQLECGGNGRAAFNPPAKGNQWTVGAVACSEWTGVRYADVLNAAGIKDSAVYTGHYGADGHLSGDPEKLPISRGVPIAKAMDPSCLIAFEMNGEAIHPMNGAPLRTLCPGWPGSTSQKWLKRIQIRDQVHDGPKMTGTSYRVPGYNVAPGTDVPKEDWVIIEGMPVKSLITFPETGAAVSGLATEVRGHAWAGDNAIASLDVSTDFGATWRAAELDPPTNPFAWQNWRAKVAFPEAGYYEVWARATDDQGRSQPFAINWNGKGYLNNTMHRIALTVT
ncbi:MAG: sulfite oxidase [Geminicoccaceae bacterium]